MVSVCNPSRGELQVGGSQSKAGPKQKLETLSEKITKAKRAAGVLKQ
jgi:hypothetical protein